MPNNTDVFIRRFKIDNFKSLMDFELSELGKFTCFIGLNGSGKSTLLQAFDFLAHLPSGKIVDWIKSREWDKNDLVSRIGQAKKHRIHFELNVISSDFGEIKWEGDYNANLMRCVNETVTVAEKTVLSLSEKTLNLDGQTIPIDAFQFTGSILSLIKAAPTTYFAALTSVVKGMKSLDLLSPHLMRKQAADATDLGIGGEKLSAWLHQLSAQQIDSLAQQLREFYPQFERFETKSLRAGWKKLNFRESFHSASGGSGILETGARHINDGLLRILAFLAQLQSGNPLVLFDEIENGVNPELAEKLVGSLLSANRQVMITTHSPMILNWIPDPIARESVILLFRDDGGATRNIRFFDIPGPKDKLGVLGPGEVYADSSIAEVSRHATTMKNIETVSG